MSGGAGGRGAQEEKRAVCIADASELAYSAVQDAIGASVFKWLSGTGASAARFASARLTAAQARGSLLWTGFYGAEAEGATAQYLSTVALGPAADAWSWLAPSGGTQYFHDPASQRTYEFFKVIPVLGTGLELGETINSCLAAIGGA